MKIEHEILINQYGQGIVEIEPLMSIFKNLDNQSKRIFLNTLLYNFIVQSKPREEDIESVIKASKLKLSYTPCVLLKKGIFGYKLQKIINLPDNELEKTFILLLNLFKAAYKRRFEQEKNNPHKWWYWDLSDNQKISDILEKYNCILRNDK